MNLINEITKNQEFEISIDMHIVKVLYKFNYLTSTSSVENLLKSNVFPVHFAFFGKAISKTGYKSHFIVIQDFIAENLTPKEYAESLCKELYYDLFPERIIRNNQLSLF